MKEVRGVAASEGVAMAKALVLKSNKFSGNKVRISADAVDEEIKILKKSIKDALFDVETLRQKAVDANETEQAEVLEAYLEIMQDEDLLNDSEQYIAEKLVDTDTALMDVIGGYAAEMAALSDPYMQARADDFRQIYRLIVKAHHGKDDEVEMQNEDFILVSTEIGPADTARIDKKYLKGVVCEKGSRTSHAAIICRACGVPMISAINLEENSIQSGDLLILDSIGNDKASLFIEPSQELKEKYKEILREKEEKKAMLKKLCSLPGKTADGTIITLEANSGTVSEIDVANEYCAEGIGLFRTEFLFMENPTRLPNEEEQYKAYKTVLEKMEGKAVVFRTLDAGGDKNISALGIPKEENPFLGWRAIRYCLTAPEIFFTQLRALIRASEWGNLKIMLPMIISKAEILKTKKLLSSVYEDLKNKTGKTYKEVPIGIMIETPAAALTADSLAEEADFFSIGSNDLTQYTLAVDRGNDYVSNLYDELHPGVLSLIKITVEAANKAGIDVHVCGEAAGDTRCTEALLKAGVRKLSMSPARIPAMKEHLMHIHL